MASSLNADQSAHYYSARRCGLPGTKDYRVYLYDSERLASPWHDIPLFSDEKLGLVNVVVEIPRWSNVKMEVCTTVTQNVDIYIYTYQQ